MFAKETYIQRRAVLKQAVGSGLLLFLGNDDQGLNYEDNAFRYRQDSTFLYYFGLSAAGLSAIIDIDNDREIIFGDELTIDHIIWMGVLPTLRDNASLVGISDVRPSAQLKTYLQQAQQSKQTIHYLPTYRAEHSLKLLDWLGLMPAQQAPSTPFIRAIVAQRNIKTDEEIAEIEKACNVTADMHLAAMKFIRPGMYEYVHKFLLSELTDPDEARANNEVGEVLVAFSVGMDGYISGVRVLKSVSPSLDAEAVRVVKMMKYWSPGKRNGMPVRAEMSIPINFKTVVEHNKYISGGDEKARQTKDVDRNVYR